MIYLVILLLLLCGVYIFDVKEVQRGRSFWYLFELIILILLAGCRYKVGGDTLSYYDEYQYMPRFSEFTSDIFNNSDYQPLWYVLNATTKLFSDDFFLFQIVHAIIINSIIFYMLKKYTSHYFIGVLFYYIFWYSYLNMEILRESISISFFILSLDSLINKKYLIYYIYSFIAFEFHISSIILFFLPILFIFISNQNRYRNLLLLLVIGVTSYMFLSTIVESLFNFSLAFNVTKLYDNLHYLTPEININGIIKLIFDVTPFLIIYLTGSIEDKCLLKLIFIYIVFSVIALSVPVIFGRFVNYLIPIILISIVKLRDKFKNLSLHKFKYNMALYIVIVLFIFIGKAFYYTRDTTEFTGNNISHFYNLYYPYQSVFFPHEDNNRETLFYNLIIDKE